VDAALGWLDDHQGWLWAAMTVSAVVFLASVVLVPAVVARIPADYFAPRRRPPGLWTDRLAGPRWMILIGKNVLGAMLIVTGVAMLVLPGQGLLTLAVGVLLLDLPGKYAAEKRLVRVRAVRRAIDWLRVRRGADPIVVERDRPRAR